MFNYNIINKPDLELNSKIIDTILKKISNLVVKKQKGTLNIVFLNAESIKNLNNKYRNINQTTDVLSFHYFEDFSDLKNEDIAGEIILNYDKIISQADEHIHSKETEFYILLIHSILHIIGYDHETDNDYTIMQLIEKRIYLEVFEK